MLAFGKQVPWVMPNPDGAIGKEDRLMYIYLYASGIKIRRYKQYDDFLYIPIQTIEFTDSEDVIRVGE